MVFCLAADDGGAPITGYVVEKKGVQRRLFQRAGQVSAHTHEMFCDELDMDTAYAFRVASLNRFGVGEFGRAVEISTGILPVHGPEHARHRAPRHAHLRERAPAPMGRVLRYRRITALWYVVTAYCWQANLLPL